MAMYTAGEFNIPLIQMDMGSLQKKYHGESEASMRKALKLIEAMAPCVLWIDEIDKGFAGMKGSGEADGGASQRAMATFLTWMQTNKKPVFSFITSNDVTKIPSELLRLGRVGKKYSVAMPCCDECKKIFDKNSSNLYSGNADFCLCHRCQILRFASGSQCHIHCFILQFCKIKIEIHNKSPFSFALCLQYTTFL